MCVCVCERERERERERECVCVCVRVSNFLEEIQMDTQANTYIHPNLKISGDLLCE